MPTISHPLSRVSKGLRRISTTKICHCLTNRREIFVDVRSTTSMRTMRIGWIPRILNRLKSNRRRKRRLNKRSSALERSSTKVSFVFFVANQRPVTRFGINYTRQNEAISAREKERERETQ